MILLDSKRRVHLYLKVLLMTAKTFNRLPNSSLTDSVFEFYEVQISCSLSLLYSVSAMRLKGLITLTNRDYHKLNEQFEFSLLLFILVYLFSCDHIGRLH